METLHRTFTNKISIAETYPNTNADANTVIASLASTATEAMPMVSVMIR